MRERGTLPELNETYKHIDTHIRRLPLKRKIEIVYEIVRNGSVRARLRGEPTDLKCIVQNMTSNELRALCVLVGHYSQPTTDSLIERITLFFFQHPIQGELPDPITQRTLQEPWR